MKEIIPKNSRYVPFVQQLWCCVPASISMIMYKRELPLISQEYMAYHLGLVLPRKHRKLFWTSRDGRKPKSGYGTQINKKEFDLNSVFEKLKIPLRMKLHEARDFTLDSLLHFLEKGEREDKDFLLCFDVGAMEGNDYHGGHVCVFDRIDVRKRLVCIVDPSQNQPKWRFVKLEDLFRGMSYHWNKCGGVWEFSFYKN